LSRECLLMEGHADCRAQRQNCSAYTHKKPPPVCLRVFYHSKAISTVSKSSAAISSQRLRFNIFKCWNSSRILAPAIRSFNREFLPRVSKSSVGERKGQLK